MLAPPLAHVHPSLDPCLLLHPVARFRSRTAPAPLPHRSSHRQVQASHDLLFAPTLDQYDHHEFPGVVPRTFLGAAVLAAISAPLTLAGTMAGMPKVWGLVVVRCHLAALVWWAWRGLRRIVSARFGRDTGLYFALITCSQFHFLFYASRPLPNTICLVFVLWAFVRWLEERWYAAIAMLIVGLSVFRCDVLILFVPVYLEMVLTGKVNVVKSVSFGILVGLTSVAVSSVVDSYYWYGLTQGSH